MTPRLHTLLATAAVLCAPLANAAPITYYYSGTIDVALGAEAPLLGQAVSGSFSYDPNATFLGGGPKASAYAAPAGAWRIDVAGGSATADTGVYGVLSGVVNNHNTVSDVLRFDSTTATGSGALAGIEYMNLYEEIDLNVLQSLALPAQMFLPGDARLQSIGFLGIGPSNTADFISGSIQCISTNAADCPAVVTTVPEPGSLALAGLALFAALRRRPFGGRHRPATVITGP